MKKLFVALLFAIPALAMAATQPPAKTVKIHIIIHNEATGRLIGDWFISTQDGVPATLQAVREIPYRSQVSSVTLAPTHSGSAAVKKTTERSLVKVGATLTVVPHVMPNGSITSFLLLSYTSLDAMRTVNFDGQTIDLPYTSSINAGHAVSTTSAKPDAEFELNPQDKFLKPGDHGYGLPLMVKVSARLDS